MFLYFNLFSLNKYLLLISVYFDNKFFIHLFILIFKHMHRFHVFYILNHIFIKCFFSICILIHSLLL